MENEHIDQGFEEFTRSILAHNKEVHGGSASIRPIRSGLARPSFAPMLAELPLTSLHLLS
jgi:hypothetical protein